MLKLEKCLRKKKGNHLHGLKEALLVNQKCFWFNQDCRSYKKLNNRKIKKKKKNLCSNKKKNYIKTNGT
jgi:hypothetical protein